MSDQELVHSIMTSIANCSLYSRSHPVVLEYSKKAVRLLDELYVDGRCSLSLLDSTLVVNDHPFSGPSDLGAGLVRRFGQERISKAVFSRGVTVAEFLDWVARMASQEAVVSTSHIAVGVVEVRGTEEQPPQLDEQYERSIRLFIDLHAEVAGSGRLDLPELYRIVTDFLDLLDRERNILKIIGPFKSHSAYTLVHITNVAILAMFLARALRIEGGLLRDIGISALMHDIGKLFIQSVMIDKPGTLDPAEWEKMKQHMVYGALFLSKKRQIPLIAPVVAYEHHMRFDGSGYPVARPAGKRQHLVSQIVAIADTFEAMRMDRPYKRSLEVPQIAAVLKAGSGTSFNPQLVQTFLVAFSESTSQGGASPEMT
jgi:hypothetical protein